MATTPSPGQPPRRRATHFFVPRSHRLFVLADDEEVAARALAELPGGDGDTWRFAGPDGVAELDPDTVRGPARLASWLFSHNVEFLRGMARAVAAGQVVLAIPAPSLRAADTAAAALRRPGVQVLAYTSHWNFVPVTP